MAIRRRKPSILDSGLAVAALTLIGVIAAAPAGADTDSYLQKLHDSGINTLRGDVEMKEWGWEVCALFARGVPADKVLQQAVYNSGSRPQYGMSVEQANLIVDYAVSDLCTGHE